MKVVRPAPTSMPTLVPDFESPNSRSIALPFASGTCLGAEGGCSAAVQSAEGGCTEYVPSAG